MLGRWLNSRRGSTFIKHVDFEDLAVMANEIVHVLLALEGTRSLCAAVVRLAFGSSRCWCVNLGGDDLVKV